jgi:hypothetical protein
LALVSAGFAEAAVGAGFGASGAGVLPAGEFPADELPPDELAADLLSAGAALAGCVAVADAAPALSGEPPEDDALGDDALDDEVPEEGDVPDAGVLDVFAGADFESLPRVRRGGASLSLLSRPRGTLSALCAVFATSVPF